MTSCMTLKRSCPTGNDREKTNNSTKRPRFIRQYPINVVSSITNDIETTNSNATDVQSVFPDVQPALSTDLLFNRIKEEVRRLQRRHQVKISTNETLEDETNGNLQTEQRSTGSKNPQYLLTLTQVNMICARLLKEREDLLREEYEQILSNKLNEQYESFLRFTQDQLTQRFSQLQFSYVS